MLCVERLAAARAIPIDAHRFYTAKGPVTPPPVLSFLDGAEAHGTSRTSSRIRHHQGRRHPKILKLEGDAMGPSGGAVSQGESASKRPCPAPGPLAPQPAIRNPQSAIRIRNPQSVSEIHIVFFFSRAVTGHFYGRAYSKSIKSVLP